MIIDKFKCLIENVGKPFKQGKHTKQIIIIKKPSPVDELGDKLFPDDFFKTQVWNKNIDKLTELKKGDKVWAFCQLNGRQETGSHGFNYYLNMNVYKIEKI